MEHEPDCLMTGLKNYSKDQCAGCRTARAAYQRGRDDAAKAVADVRDIWRNPGLAWDTCDAASGRGAFARRGDGEQ